MQDEYIDEVVHFCPQCLAEYLQEYKDKVEEAEYKGRKVTLGKPFLTPSGPKKRAVYVKNKKGNVIKVNFGDPHLSIKRDNPKKRKSFRARHHCATAKDRTTPRYWSCKYWSTKPVSKMEESKNPHLYQIKGVLVTNTEKRIQRDILSDMRSISGVTIVTPHDYQGGDNPINNKSYTVELSVKVDLHPFHTFGKKEIKNIILQIKKVDGVVRFSPDKLVKRLK